MQMWIRISLLIYATNIYNEVEKIAFILFIRHQ